MIRRRVVVRGQVQGVFFRNSCQREARRHQVRGWVANRTDGAVEAAFEGEPDDVAALVAWSRTGPPHAIVTEVVTTEEEPRGERDFVVRPAAAPAD
jgi:acylphosphatase